MVTTEALALTVTEAPPLAQLEDVRYQVIHWVPGRLRIRIPRLTYDSEYAAKLSNLVGSVDFVTNVRISSAASSLVVEYHSEIGADASATLQEQILTAIQQAPFIDYTTIDREEKSNHEIDYGERLGLPALGLLLGLGSMAGLPIPGFVIFAAIIAGAMPVFRRAFDGIQQQHQLNIDFLDGLAITLQAIQGRYFPPAFMLSLIESGEIIRDLTARGTERASLDLLDCLGKYALVERDGKEVQIPLKQVINGDRVVVYPGDQNSCRWHHSARHWLGRPVQTDR